MDKRNTEKLKEELKNESHFSGEKFVEEVLPLLKDYFAANFEFDGKGIVCSFENGQKFYLSAKEL